MDGTALSHIVVLSVLLFALCHVILSANESFTLFMQHLGKEGASSMCNWLIAQKCRAADCYCAINDECGVPHSLMANADNEHISPDYLPWNEPSLQVLLLENFYLPKILLTN